MMASISVVMSVYNGARFIADTLASVFSQTHPAHEIIVVNDGSLDNSLDVLKKFQRQIHIVDQINAGVSVARNVGARMAAGDYVAFLDQDDYWRADKLEIFAATINNLGAEKTQFMFSDFIRENYFTKEKLPSNTELNPWIFQHLECVLAQQAVYLSSAEAAFKYLLRGYPIYPSTMVVARSRFNIVNWLEHFKLGEDFSFSLLNAMQGPVTYIDQPLCIVTRHDSNGSLDELRMAQSDIAVLEWALEQEIFSADNKNAIRESLGARLAGLGWNYRHKSRAESLKYYVKALGYPHAKIKSLKGLVRTLIS